MWWAPDDTMEGRRAVHEHDRVIGRPWEKVVIAFVRRRTRVDLTKTTQQRQRPNQPNTRKKLRLNDEKKKNAYPSSQRFL